MKAEKHGSGESAVISLTAEDGEVLITDAASALELMVNLSGEFDCGAMIIPKAAVTEDFFRLSTGLAGGVLQKFVNYRFRLAIVGDFSGYTSKPLKDFIYESNKGKHIFFLSSKEEALKILGAENGI